LLEIRNTGDKKHRS